MSCFETLSLLSVYMLRYSRCVGGILCLVFSTILHLINDKSAGGDEKADQRNFYLFFRNFIE